MFLLIPHKEIELQIIKTQKKIISNINCKKYLPFQSFPLWICLDFFSENITLEEGIKKIKENIQEIKILGIKTKEESIDLQFLIKYKNEEYRKDLPIVGFINSTDELEDKQFLECVKDLPQKINIFRIGYSENYREECHSEVKNFWLVTSEWKKIKN